MKTKTQGVQNSLGPNVHLYLQSVIMACSILVHLLQMIPTLLHQGRGYSCFWTCRDCEFRREMFGFMGWEAKDIIFVFSTCVSSCSRYGFLITRLLFFIEFGITFMDRFVLDLLSSVSLGSEVQC